MIYTKTGDKGDTSLVGGKRVSKSDLRLETYGTIDELNSFIGLLICEMIDETEKNTLQICQNKLFTVGSYLATDTSQTELRAASILKEEDVKALEEAIDAIEEKIPRMTGFILPGGVRSAALAHVCRTVCRRSERLICRLAETIEIDETIKSYINRLSDYLFLVARNECFITGTSEIYWNNL